MHRSGKNFLIPNCDCGTPLRRNSGRVCSRCGCVNCSKCTKKVAGEWVGPCCITKEEHAS
jgi:hypothetical protein